MTERCRCLVPHCKRTTGRVPVTHEWICSEHWRRVSRYTKRRRQVAKRLMRKADGRFRKLYHDQKGYTDEQLQAYEAVARIEQKSWERCKAEAIEKAAGI